MSRQVAIIREEEDETRWGKFWPREDGDTYAEVPLVGLEEEGCLILTAGDDLHKFRDELILIHLNVIFLRGWDRGRGSRTTSASH